MQHTHRLGILLHLELRNEHELSEEQPLRRVISLLGNGGEVDMTICRPTRLRKPVRCQGFTKVKLVLVVEN